MTRTPQHAVRPGSPAAVVSGLCIYPIKSAGGLALTAGALDDRGLALDRRWMLVDQRGVALTQRQFPSLRLVTPVLEGEGLRVSAPGMPEVRVPGRPDGPARPVTLWDQAIAVRAVSAAVSAWFSAYLQHPCELVFMPDSSRRRRKDQLDGVLLSLSDGNPLHLISEASLADLNRRLAQPVDHWRFRPNLVVGGSAAYDEDYWRRVRIAGIDFDVVESCARCGIVNVDAQGRGTGPVLRTLGRYRRWGPYIPFGQHLNHRRAGTLRVGDALEVVERGDEPNASG